MGVERPLECPEPLLPVELLRMKSVVEFSGVPGTGFGTKTDSTLGKASTGDSGIGELP